MLLIENYKERYQENPHDLHSESDTAIFLA